MRGASDEKGGTASVGAPCSIMQHLSKALISLLQFTKGKMANDSYTNCLCVVT